MKNQNTPDKRFAAIKRFIDRSDRNTIIDSVEGFARRGHDHIPRWLVTIFFYTQVVLMALMLFLAFKVVSTIPGQTNVIYIIYYMVGLFLLVLFSSIFLVKKLKDSLFSTEFMSLFLSKSMETYSSSFAVVNKERKLVFFNENFAREFMVSKDIENKTYSDLLDKTYFSPRNIELIEDSIENSHENHFAFELNENGKDLLRNVKIVPLPRPKNLFLIKIITMQYVEIKK
jgi:hypothetical protein